MARKASRRSSGAPALQALDRGGVAYRVHEYGFDPGDLGIGEQAAVALGIPPGRLFKTLMVIIDGQSMAMALSPVNAETRMKALAAALGGKRAAMAPLAQAERASGYVKGGISPFSQRQKLAAVIDRSVLDYATVFVNGGRRGLQIEIAPADLIATLDASLADLAR